MEKTELMKKYETETGLKSVQVVGYHWVNEETVTDEYAEWLEREYERAVSRFDELGRIHCSIKADQNKKIRELEVKASSYDRLLAKKLTDEELDSPPASKILKEMAEKAEAYDRLMSGEPTAKEIANVLNRIIAMDADFKWYAFGAIPYGTTKFRWVAVRGSTKYRVPCFKLTFDGDWKDSLTFPDGWREK